MAGKNDVVRLQYGNILLISTYCHSTEKEGASPEVTMVPMPMNFHNQAAMNLFSKQA